MRGIANASQNRSGFELSSIQTWVYYNVEAKIGHASGQRKETVYGAPVPLKVTHQIEDKTASRPGSTQLCALLGGVVSRC